MGGATLDCSFHLNKNTEGDKKPILEDEIIVAKTETAILKTKLYRIRRAEVIFLFLGVTVSVICIISVLKC